VAEIIRHAKRIFITGGDQADYIHGWKGTPVEDAINANIAAASDRRHQRRLAILGECVYGALGDKPDDKDLASTDVLPNPILIA